MKKSQSLDTQKMLRSAIVPAIMVLAMWAVHLLSFNLDFDLTKYGILPRDITGLRGILFSPFIHGDWKHLTNNSVPLFFLGAAIFYFYPKSAWSVWIYGWIVTGFWVWVGARESFHIGASGLVYVFAFFLFFSGVFNRNAHMMGLSLLIVFLYGSMVWGVLPIDVKISWESHLLGAIIGFFIALVFRKDGPQRKKFNLEEGIEDLEEKFGKEYWNGMPQHIIHEAKPLRVHYVWKPKTREDGIVKPNDDQQKTLPNEDSVQ